MSKIIYSIPSWDNWTSLTTLRKFIDQTEHLDGSEKVRIVGGSLDGNNQTPNSVHRHERIGL